MNRFDSKKYSRLISYFNQHYVATGKIRTELSKKSIGAQKIRNSSDYDDFYIVSREEAENQIKNAEKFLCKIDEFLIKQI